MALRKKTLAIPLTGPLERRNGGEDLTANLTALPAVPRALNLYRSRTGEWKQRPGHTAFFDGSQVIAGGTVGGQMRLFEATRQLRFSDQNDPAPSISGAVSLAAFGGRMSLFSPAQGTGDDAADPAATSSTQFTESAIAGNVIITCSTIVTVASPGTSRITVTAARQSDQAAIPEAFGSYVFVSGGYSRCRVVYSSAYDKFVVFWTTPGAPSTAATNLMAIVLSPAGVLPPGGIGNIVNALGSPLTLAADLIGTATSANAHFDVMVEEDAGDVVVAYRGTAGNLRALRFKPSTSAVTTGPISVVAGGDVGANGIAWARCSNFPQSVYRLFTAINSAVGVVERTITKATLVQASALTVKASPGAVGSVCGFVDDLNGFRSCLFDVVHADPSRSAIWGNQTSSGTWSTAALFRSGVSLRLYGHPIAMYPGTAAGEHWIVPVCGTIQFAGKLFFLSPNMVGYEFDGVALEALDGKMDEAPAADGHLGSVFSYSGSLYFGCVERLGRSGDINVPATALTAFVKNARTVQLTPGARTTPLQLDPDLILMPGATWGRADGSTANSAPWPISSPPPVTGITQTTGGALAVGDFQYSTVLVNLDQAGRRWAGPASVPVKGTITGVNNALSVVLTDAPTRQVGNVILEMYRTKVNGTQWFRYNSFEKGFGLFAGTALVDGVSDTALETGLPLYADSGELLHVAPPPSHIAWIAGQRIVAVDDHNPSRVWASSEFTPGEGPWFHPDMSVMVPGGEEIVSGAFMDGRSFLFTRKSIFAVAGAWPGRTGAGQLPEVQRVATGVGGYSQESTLVTAEGIWFYSEDRGMCLLTRGLAVTSIGKIVDGVITSPPVAAIQAEHYDQVRIYQANGVVAVFDQIERQWAHWQIAGLGGKTVTGAFVHSRDVYVFTSSGMLKEDAAAKTDSGAAFPVDIDLRIPIGPPGGKVRVYRTILSGLCSGDTTLSATIFNDFGNVGSGEEAKVIVVKARPGETLPGLYEVTLRPRRGRCDSMLLRLSFQSTDPGLTYRALAVEVGGYRPSTVARMGSSRQA